jgi:phosphoserine phosphatase RsbU/P
MNTQSSVQFPLKLKLLIVMIVLIASSLTVFVGIALTTFKEDKAAYIYESLLNKASSGEILLSQKLGPHQAGLKIQGEKIYLDGKPLDNLKDLLPEDSTFIHSLVIPHGGKFFIWEEGKLQPAPSEYAEIFETVFEKSIFEAVREFKKNNESWLLAYRYNPKLNYAFVTSLPESEVFAVTRYLIEKSLFYGLFILGISVILSVLLAKPLTASLERVQDLTQDIASGNFTRRIKIKGHDEVTSLAGSVNHMADKIVVFMEEMKEKARLENEVQVAQLVQASFFPENSVENEAFSIRGHLEAASECGGDWWGVHESEDWTILFIADATGHGVPAALLTATINCCKTSLSYLSELDPQILSRPGEILRFMNQAVHGSGKEIQVTCFVASLNKKTKKMHFSNASHTPPLFFNARKDTLGKEDFQPLMEPNGPRLGQSLGSTYTSRTMDLASGDTIFFYTDGLIEAENSEGQRWGERRLLKTLGQYGNEAMGEVIPRILGELKNFSSEKFKDDVTVASLRVK